jgi:hypothetical protein
VNNSPVSRIYLLCQYEHHLADYGYFIGWNFMCFLAKIWTKPVLIVLLGACICLAFVTLIIVRKGEVIAQKGNSAGTLNSCEVPQAISKEDYKFLDDLVQQQDQDNERQTNPVAKPGQNVAKAERDQTRFPEPN